MGEGRNQLRPVMNVDVELRAGRKHRRLLSSSSKSQTVWGHYTVLPLQLK